MSAWKIRHEGSPRSVDGLSLQQVLEGLQDGRWEPTDEVMGPHDKEWVAIENHPQLEEVAADLEPPPPRVYDDETRLDFNALIDVTLVLLIFFMLITTYAALQKQLEAPPAAMEKPGLPRVTKDQVAQQMIKVSVTLENNQPVTRIEDKVISQAPGALEFELSKIQKQSRKTEMLLDHSDDVPERAVVAVLDAARGAGLEKIRLLVPDKPRGR
jgi:biopolymer transport protein ExbD